jgi:hypothetical protein
VVPDPEQGAAESPASEADGPVWIAPHGATSLFSLLWRRARYSGPQRHLRVVDPNADQQHFTVGREPHDASQAPQRYKAEALTWIAVYPTITPAFRPP